MCLLRRRIHVSFEEEDTCVLCLSCLLHQLTPRAASLHAPTHNRYYKYNAYILKILWVDLGAQTCESSWTQAQGAQMQGLAAQHPHNRFRF